ncbi:uncharacterized protein LOC128234314 isoform X1 [Mya arenaria]|uniref:uncharacterized protein LOC128234314 isoform X1 n=1 Tax=Mya arenaria TaxID=6604 RepID=UPI0022E06082|nr:uncharacterized protein LOC128234314 isoform X1 [Mya arenaria]
MDRSHRYHLKGVLLVVMLGTSTASPPSVSVHLDSDPNPLLGNSVVIECEADDFDGNDVVFKWTFRNMQIENMSSRGKYMEELDSYYSHLTIHDIGHADLGQYECFASSSANGQLSDKYNLNFDFNPSLYMSKRQAKIGDDVTMVCRHNPNQGDWKFENRRGNVISSAEYFKRFVNHVTSFVAPVYMKNITLHNVTLEQSGNYICFNTRGQPKEDTTTLEVNGMTINCHSQNNEDMILTEGVDDTIVCTVQANPAIERDADVGLWWSPTVGSAEFEKIPNDVCNVGMEPGPPLTTWTLTIDVKGKYVYRLINKRIKIQIKDQYVYINIQIQQPCQPPCGPNMKCDMKGQCSCTPGYRLNPVGIGTGCVPEENEQPCQPPCWPNMKCDMKKQCSCTPGFRPNPVGIGTGCIPEGNDITTTEIAYAKPQIAAIAGGVTAGVITMVVCVVVFCVLRNQYSCAFKVTRKEGSRSRPTVPFDENPGYNAAVRSETNTPFYDELKVPVYHNTIV